MHERNGLVNKAKLLGYWCFSLAQARVTQNQLHINKNITQKHEEFSSYGFCKIGNILDNYGDISVIDNFQEIIKSNCDSKAKKQYLKPAFDKTDIRQLNVFAALPKQLKSEIVAIANLYFKPNQPLLTYANLWKSKSNKLANFEGSQKWHLDHEDTKQIKLFIYLMDVDESNGALELINASDSRSFLETSSNSHKEKHFDSLELDNKLQRLTGKCGDVFFVDTSRCIHRGARVLDGVRNIMVSQFLPYRLSRRMLSLAPKFVTSSLEITRFR